MTRIRSAAVLSLALLLPALTAGCSVPQGQAPGTAQQSALPGLPAALAKAAEWQGNATLLLIGSGETADPHGLLDGGAPPWAVALLLAPDPRPGDGLAPAWLYLFEGSDSTLLRVVVTPDGVARAFGEGTDPASAQADPRWWVFRPAGAEPLRLPVVDSDRVVASLVAQNATWALLQGKEGSQVSLVLEGGSQPQWRVSIVNKELRRLALHVLDARTGAVLEP